jgi:predicted dehydrogenase
MLSTSYGPGRYDNNYERKGLDYPYAYVRWTENRNMTEYLRLLGEGQIKLEKMISSTFPIEQVEEAFKSLQTGESRPLMVLLQYNQEKTYQKELPRITQESLPSNGQVRVALIGAGGFATGVHLPNLKNLANKFQIRGIVSRDGLKAKNTAAQFGAAWSSTDPEEAFKDPEVDLVIIATRHDSHASLALRALAAGKNVFLEKPLAVNLEELTAIENFYASSAAKKPLLFVGFNRRFSEYAREMKAALNNRIGPALIHYRMNSGFVPEDNWVHEHGGRIIGEACHNIDLVRYLIGAPVESVNYEQLSPQQGKFKASDNRVINIKFKDGSVANILYFAIGSKDVSKELVEIHFDEKTLIMDNFKSLKGYGVKVRSIETVASQKGQLEELSEIYDYFKGLKKEWPISLQEMLETTRVSIIAAGLS